ncbi:MAG: hypothetical protein QOE24_1421 [Frankiales bacterium]|nr:hypothetical protein [Frankiales bacterium]
MTAIRIETVPQTWNDADTAFFTLVARLFSPEFLYGAGVLLAAYDTDTDTPFIVSAEARGSAASSAMVPLAVRRTC